MSVPSQVDPAAFVAALDTLLYDLEDTILPIQVRYTDWVEERVNGVWSASTPPAERIAQFVDINLPEDGNEGPLDWTPLYRINEAIADTTYNVETAVAQPSARLAQSLQADIASLLPSTSEVFSGVVKLFGNLLDGLLGNLSDDGSFWQKAAEVLSSEIEQHHDKVSNTTSIILNGLIAAFNERWSSQDGLLDRLERAPTTPGSSGSDSVGDYIASIENQPRIIRNLTNTVLFIAGSLHLLGARIAGPAAVLEQGSLADVLPTPLGPATLVNLVRMRIVAEDWAKNHAKRSGVTPELFDLLHKGDERLLDVSQMQDLWRRTGSDQALDDLPRAGFSPKSIERIKALSLAEATPSDVVRFLVRDALDPSAVESGQLDEDFDRKYDANLFRKAGVTEELARYYWRAHWQLPSPTQGYEMLHRKQLTMDELRNLLKLADYAPAYVDKLISIAYLTPGRIDVRRMWETGIITDENELSTYYEAMGYSPDHARVMVGFTKKLKEIADESKADRRYGRIATGIVRAFVVGSLSEVQARSALESLGFTPERADIRIKEAVYGRTVERADRIRESVGRAYIRGFSPADEARSRLEGYGFDAAEIDSLFESWNLDLELREETEAERGQRDLSKTEILAAYDDGLIDRNAASNGLVSLGYDASESGTLLALADAKAVRADAKSVEASARTQYLARRITALDARGILEGIGYTPTRVSALLSRWTTELEERRPDISNAQLERMLMQGVIPIEQMEERLRQKGYTESDISALLTLYGTDMSIAEDKLRIQQEQFNAREARLSRQGDRRLDLTERGQNLAGERFAEQQAGLQSRFDAGQRQSAELQQERLDSAARLQADRLASQTERDAVAILAARERQATTIAASNERLDKQITAAAQRQEAALAAAQSARDQASRDRAAAQQAQDAREAQRLQAQADRQNQSIAAAERRAQDAAVERARLQGQRDQAQRDLTELRGQITELRDVRQEAARLRTEVRQEQARIRTETRTQARRDITSSDAAAVASRLQSVQLQQQGAVAELQARFAGILAQVADSRRQEALDAKQAAERALANATPMSTLLDGVM